MADDVNVYTLAPCLFRDQAGDMELVSHDSAHGRSTIDCSQSASVCNSQREVRLVGSLARNRAATDNYRTLLVYYSLVHSRPTTQYNSTTDVSPVELLLISLLLGRPFTVVTGGLIKCSWCFFFFRQVPSAVPRPIAVKLCHISETGSIR